MVTRDFHAEHIQNVDVFSRLLYNEVAEVYDLWKEELPPALTQELETILKSLGTIKENCIQAENFLKEKFKEDEEEVPRGKPTTCRRRNCDG